MRRTMLAALFCTVPCCSPVFADTFEFPLSEWAGSSWTGPFGSSYLISSDPVDYDFGFAFSDVQDVRLQLDGFIWEAEWSVSGIEPQCFGTLVQSEVGFTISYHDTFLGATYLDNVPEPNLPEPVQFSMDRSLRLSSKAEASLRRGLGQIRIEETVPSTLGCSLFPITSTSLTIHSAALVFEGEQDVTEGDFDGDAVPTIQDLNRLLAIGPLASDVAVIPGENDRYDLDGDGVLNLRDRDRWLSSAAIAAGFSSPYLPGDANLDGVVDAADFSMWESSRFTQTTGWDTWDFNGDGHSDVTDANLWLLHRAPLSDTSNVPEPCGAVLALAAYLTIGLRLPDTPSQVDPARNR